MSGEKRRELYRGRIVSLGIEEHLMPDGRRESYEIVRHSGGAAVLPVFEDGRVMLIRQFRAAAGGMLLEVPAGRLESGESPEQCALRELREEAGLTADRLQGLGEMLPTPGFCDERVALFVARDLTAVRRAPEPDEYIEPVLLPIEEALERVLAGGIPDAKTQLSLLLFSARKGGYPCP